jgi:hypothetical protein
MEYDEKNKIYILDARGDEVDESYLKCLKDLPVGSVIKCICSDQTVLIRITKQLPKGKYEIIGVELT